MTDNLNLIPMTYLLRGYRNTNSLATLKLRDKKVRFIMAWRYSWKNEQA